MRKLRKMGVPLLAAVPACIWLACALPLCVQAQKPPPANDPISPHFEILPSLVVPSLLQAPEPLPPPTQELSLDRLIAEVLARNPSLAQMQAAWQAASARIRQVTSLEDPMVGGSYAPGILGSRELNGGWRVDVAQKFPFPGKLQLRGQEAALGAEAAFSDVDDVRLQLIEATRNAFYDYFLVERLLAVNGENLRLLKEFKQNAETRYKTGLAPPQDVLQAEVELGRQQERQLELGQMQKVARAVIKRLLHESQDAPLAAPPPKLTPPGTIPPVQGLRQQAVARRPDVQALSQRLAAAETALALAFKDYRPDMELMAAYDSFWQERPLRTMVGVRINLPVYRGRRHAAVYEAQAKIAQRRAELDRLIDQINFQVQEAHAQLERNKRTVELYEKTILRAAEENVKSAQSAYVNGKVPFLSLIEAQRSYVMLRERYYESLAAALRSQATLDRVVGVPGLSKE